MGAMGCNPPFHPHPQLRWSAFALALVLSLGSAIPIVYFCKLPECGRHAVAAAAAAAGAAAAWLAS